MFEQGPIWSHCHENLRKLNSLHPEPYKEDKGGRFHSVNFFFFLPDAFSSQNKFQILPKNVSKEILFWPIFFQVKQLKKWSTRQFQMSPHYSIAMFSKNNNSLFHIMYLQPSFLPRLYSHSRSLENTQTRTHSHLHTRTHTHTQTSHICSYSYTHISQIYTHKKNRHIIP